MSAESSESDAQPEILRAVELIGLNRPEQALEALARAQAGAPEYATTILLLMATAELQRGQSAPAIRHAEAALAAEPDHPTGWLLLGQGHHAAGNPRKAVAAFETALELDPDSSSALQIGAQALSDLRRHEDAEAWALDARELAPEDPDSHFALGYVLHERRPSEAAAAYEDALALDPEHFRSLHNLATLTVRGGNRAQGVTMMADALVGTRGGAFTLTTLDVLLTHVILRLHRLSFVSLFLLGTVTAATSQYGSWAGILSATALLAVTILIGWRLAAPTLRSLRESLPRQGASFLRGYPRRNAAAAIWLVLVALSWLALLVGLAAAIVAALMGLPHASYRLLPAITLGLALLMLGAALSWVAAWRQRRRLARTRRQQ